MDRQGLVDFVKIHHSDSVKFLKQFKTPVDFLYLDSYDYTDNIGEQIVSQLHQLDEFKAMVREQFQILQEEHEQAIEAIVDLIPNIEIRECMTEQVEKIVSVIGILTPLQQERLDRLKSL